ncbi:hypothetical protein TRVL_07282 [Trypanosoma vivax]|nr:hypothetical protein TRVL_07282 [Trypanosoma vivax]
MVRSTRRSLKAAVLWFTRFMSVWRWYSTCRATLKATEKHTTQPCCSGPGGFTSTSPHRGVSRRTRQRTSSCTPCAVCTGSLISTISCGQTFRSLALDVVSGAGTIVSPKESRREKVVLGFLLAITVRNVW